MTIVGDLDCFAASFALELQAGNQSPKPIETYGEGIGQLLDHLTGLGIHSADAASREHIDGFIAKLLETRSAATANNRFRALQQFFKWLEANEYIGYESDGENAPAART